MTPLEETTKNQQKAAHPARSVFVMANAGAGKTRVLTNRVARLLLDEIDPAKILCITFTKAAAAEMADRLFGMLGSWALHDDDELHNELRELEGDDFKERTPEELIKARRLFARALETPGGLKIQTIHSFCESVLRRFPIEAGASPGFTVIEDAEGRALIETIIDQLALQSNTSIELADAFERLSWKQSAKQIRETLRDAVYDRLKYEANFARYESLDGVINGLAAALDVSTNETPDEIKMQFVTALDREKMRAACDVMHETGGKPDEYAVAVDQFLSAKNLDDQWSALERAFLTGSGTPLKYLTTNAMGKICSWTPGFLRDQQEKFYTLTTQLNAIEIFLDSAALYTLVDQLLERYRCAKAVRAVLDFDDLITRTHGLFVNTKNDWVMYKLDYGIEHILIDEAQDTSPLQWDVIEALFAEFLSGDGARDIDRSFFAVGDMKQSIYSFQGADAGLFLEKEDTLGQKLSAVTNYESIPLALSFRTTEPVLTFVDALYEPEGAAEGLGKYPIPAHRVNRAEHAGRVELWPLTPRPKTEKPNPWDAPVDEPEENHPVRTLSDRVAKTIKTWLSEQRLLEAKGRPVRAGDILILVQSRSAVFDEVIERLSVNNVAVAGADRLKLLEDPAIEDLISYLRLAVTPSDDLSLAEILKSPLFGFDDDRDLFPLAYERAEGVSLWASLNARANEKQHWTAARDEIAAATSISQREGPFAFLNHVLQNGCVSGRRRFYERMSLSARDAIDEMLRQALHFENSNPRNSRSFLNWFEKNAGDIKREMDRTHDAVRVMTVHGAKGLEAPVVFLIDAQKPPNLRAGAVLPLEDPSENADAANVLRVMTGPKEKDTSVTTAAKEARDQASYEEYRRLLYVAATRAEDELYICGVESGKGGNAKDKAAQVKTWHALAVDAFEAIGDRVEAEREPFWDGDEAVRLSLSCAQTASPSGEESEKFPEPGEIPPWLFEIAAPESLPDVLAPSRLQGEADDNHQSSSQHAAFAPTGSDDPYFRGRIIHRMLELLPQIDPERRAKSAEALLSHLAPQTPLGERTKWRDEIFSILENPDFGRVFAQGSRAEVSVGGVLPGDAKGRTVAGEIDRLVIEENDIFIVDYKTNRPPPQNVADADPAYVRQLAVYRALLQEIYPAHKVTCALLWTFAPRLMPVPEAMLDHAFARILQTG